MKIEILGWSSQDLWIPNIDLKLSSFGEPTPAFTFIQMPNGSGKTRIIELLSLTLGGGADDLRGDQVKKYAHFDRDTPPTGQFKVTVAVDGEPVTFSIKFDFDAEKLSYLTTSPHLGGAKVGFCPPPKAQDYFSEPWVQNSIHSETNFEKLAGSLRYPDEFSQSIEGFKPLLNYDLEGGELFEAIFKDAELLLSEAVKGGGYYPLDRVMRILSTTLIKREPDPGIGGWGDYLISFWSILLALQSSMNFNCPLIVERPSGAMDMQHRNLFSKFLLKSKNQFIAFISPSERSGIVTELEKSGAEIKYFTLFGSENSNARFTEGKGYFHGYDG